MVLDARGLYLKVTGPDKGRWVYRFKLNGTTRDMGLGSLEDVTLAEARVKADDARKLAKAGIDPVEERTAAIATKTAAQAQAQANRRLFIDEAQHYIESKRPGWKNAKHAQQWENTLKTYAYPIIGQKPVADISTDDVMRILTPIWNSKAETASRVRSRIELILNAAKARKFRTGENPAQWRGHLDSLLAKHKSSEVEHQPALPWEQLPAFMRAVTAEPDLSAKAVRLTILTALRTSEVLQGTWSEVNLEAKMWIIPAKRMKQTRHHRVPLSQAAIDLLSELPKIDGNPFLFPGAKEERPISNMAMLMKIRRLDERSRANNGPGWRDEHGEVITMHGFRSSFSDWAAEATHFPTIVTEQALAHKVPNATEAAYRRGDLLKKREEMMQAWADYITGTDDGNTEAKN
ncbi:tyrosine-type recombinase/integrase [Pseudomonas cavernicola]|nr:site-specific integrase [Pseudomonas cavernicola]